MYSAKTVKVRGLNYLDHHKPLCDFLSMYFEINWLTTSCYLLMQADLYKYEVVLSRYINIHMFFIYNSKDIL